MVDIQKIGLELIEKNISKDCRIEFTKGWFTFYIDDSGQRGHYILPYKPYGTHNTIPNTYVIKRVLSFENEVDKGKEKAVLGVLYLRECKVISIEEGKVTFENFIFHLTGNTGTRGVNFKYEW